MCEWVLLCLRWLVDLIFVYGGLTDGIFNVAYCWSQETNTSFNFLQP
jgi:hypothetical protein